MNNLKKEPWRIAVAAISVAIIVFLWVKNDVSDVYTSISKEQLLPVIVTSVVVSLIKIALIAVVVYLIKWIVDKSKKKK